MTTYADMYTRIGDEIQDASLTIQVQRAIQDAIAIFEPVRFYFNQTIGTFNTVANQEFYTGTNFTDIPLLIEVDSLLVTIMGVDKPVQAEDYYQMDRAQPGVLFGTPWAYSYYNEQIRMFPIPDQAYP